MSLSVTKCHQVLYTILEKDKIGENLKNESKNLEWKQTLTKEVKHEIVSFLNSSSGFIDC